MPQLKFPYLYNSLRPRAPLAPIILATLEDTISRDTADAYVLLDTGADISIFSYDELKLLLDLGELEKSEPISGIGGSIGTWLTKKSFPISIGGRAIYWPIRLRIVKGLSINILGRDFLNAFNVAFNGKSRQIIIDY